MDFTVPEAQTDLAALTRRIAEDWSAKNPKPGDSGFHRELWAALARSGIVKDRGEIWRHYAEHLQPLIDGLRSVR